MIGFLFVSLSSPLILATISSMLAMLHIWLDVFQILMLISGSDGVTTEKTYDIVWYARRTTEIQAIQRAWHEDICWILISSFAQIVWQWRKHHYSTRYARTSIEHQAT
jgi:hypothetical protein